MRAFSLGMAIGLSIILLAVLVSLFGCITPYQVQHMTPDQINAWSNAQEDVYACLGINGPPPNGSGFLIVVPKGSNPQINLSPTCQVLSGTLGNKQ